MNSPARFIDHTLLRPDATAAAFERLCAEAATAADVALLSAASAGRIEVKAAGGIRDWAACRAMLAAGVGRIGTSAGVQIMREWLAAREQV